MFYTFFTSLILSVMLISPGNAAIYEDVLQKAYIAYYARPADAPGLNYWSARLESENGDLKGLIDSFGHSDEYTQRFSGLDNTALVNNIYQNLFNRNADSAGLTYYVNLLNSGISSLAKIALNIIDGAIADDAVIVDNKLTVSRYYTSREQAGAISYNSNNAVGILAVVDSSHASVATAKTQIDPTGIATQDAKLFFNGKIYTVNDQQEWAEAVYVVDGKIAFVGSDAEAQAQASADAERIDLKGKMMMPGIQDVHMHPLEARSPFAGTCLLSNQETNAENFIAELKACAPNQPATDWVLGSGHSVFTLLESERLPIEILDAAIPDRPALIMEETSHSVWANSLALERAGIDRNTPNPQGGVIVKDAQSGEPTGILFDAAGDVLMSHAWLATDAIKELNYQGLLEAVAEVNSYGITSVAEGRTYWKRGFQDAWYRAEEEDKLTVRAMLNLWAYPAEDDASQIAKIKSLYRDNPGDLVRTRQIKVYSDGILINSTAAMLEPYLETLGEIPGNNGLNYFTQQRLTQYIGALGDFDFHIHAIGDRGVHEALNAIEAGQTDQSRHRVTHLEVVHINDFTRFKTLGVIADMQVAGDFAQPGHWPENEFLIGARANNLVPLKLIHNTGAKVTLSSDWDVSTLNPFVGMQNALTRAPQNLSDLAPVIKAYTLTPAYALRQETTTGSIEVGKYADLIVLDRNVFEIPQTQINQTKVMQTYLQGDLVYSR